MGQNRSPWVNFPAGSGRAGITPFGIVPEERLALDLRKYPFALVPCAPLEGRESPPRRGLLEPAGPYPLRGGGIAYACPSGRQRPLLRSAVREALWNRFNRSLRYGQITGATKQFSDPQLQGECGAMPLASLNPFQTGALQPGWRNRLIAVRRRIEDSSSFSPDTIPIPSGFGGIEPVARVQSVLNASRSLRRWIASA